MNSKKRLAFLFGIISLSAVCPLSAHADPRGIVNPAICNSGDIGNAASGYVQISDRSVALDGDKAISAYVNASRTISNAGLGLRVVAVNNREPADFDKVVLRVDASQAAESNVQVILDFDKFASRRYVALDKVRKSGSGDFKQYTIQDGKEISVGTETLRRLVILVVASPSRSQRIRIGKIDITHKREDATKIILLPRIVDTCNAFPF